MRANRNLGTDQAIPAIPGFNPGGDDFGVVRMIDGHDPYRGGTDGSNVHVPSSSASPNWDDPQSVYEVGDTTSGD